MSEIEIEFLPPDADEPGYLLREKTRLEYLAEFNRGASPEVVEKMVNFLLPYVEKPEDRKEAREALWQMSNNQFKQLLEVISGGGAENPTI